MSAPISQEKKVESFVKKNYKLIYLKRNARLKIRDAFAWGLDEADILLLIKTWKTVALAMGEEGKKRWREIELEIPEWRNTFKRIKGINWVDQKSISSISLKQSPYSMSELFPNKKKEISEPLKAQQGERL